MDAIHVEKLTRKFEDLTAVDAVSFAVPEGELFGLLGPNGAGKTTTINMLSTLLRPTSGRAEVAGFDIVRNRDSVRRSIGIVFQEPALDGKLTGRENLEFHSMMYGMGREERRRKIDEVLSLNLPVDMIAPSHGVIWRKDPLQIVKKYQQCASQTPEKTAVILNHPRNPSRGRQAPTFFSWSARQGRLFVSAIPWPDMKNS